MKDIKRYSICIPVQMCVYVAQLKLFNPFRLYLLLTREYSGVARLPGKEIERLAGILGVNHRTVTNNLNKLIELNWVGHDKVTGNYFPRGLEHIRIEYGFGYKTCSWFDTTDLTAIRVTVISAVLGYMVKQQRHEKIKGALQSGTASLPLIKKRCYFPVANNALAQILDCSNSTASIYKRLAVRSGFIERKRNSLVLGPGRNLSGLRKAYPEVAHKMVVKKGVVHLLMSDRLKSNVQFGKRK